MDRAGHPCMMVRIHPDLSVAQRQSKEHDPCNPVLHLWGCKGTLNLEQSNRVLRKISLDRNVAAGGGWYILAGNKDEGKYQERGEGNMSDFFTKEQIKHARNELRVGSGYIIVKTDDGIVAYSPVYVDRDTGHIFNPATGKPLVLQLVESEGEE